MPHAAVDALTVDHGDHVWDLARLGWALHGSTDHVDRADRRVHQQRLGSVVVWDHEKAAALFDALAADQPVPSTVLGGQP